MLPRGRMITQFTLEGFDLFVHVFVLLELGLVAEFFVAKLTFRHGRLRIGRVEALCKRMLKSRML